MALGKAGEAVVVFFKTNMGTAEASIPAMRWRDITSNDQMYSRQTILDASKTPWCWWADIGGAGAADNHVADPVACFGQKWT